jgi:CubicO group peptidase (beta-lactamase class C family)
MQVIGDAGFRTVLLVLASTAFAVVARGQDSPDLARFAGHWTGVAIEAEGAFHTEHGVDIEVRRAPTGGLELINRDRGILKRDPIPVHVTSPDQWTAAWPGLFPGDITATATLRKDGGVLEYRVGVDSTAVGRVLHAELRRDNPASKRFQFPRLQPDGLPEYRYQYVAPVARNDGWTVSTLEREGMDRRPLEKMIGSILQQTGSPGTNVTNGLLIARHGHLVLEEYFWGYGANLAHGISSCTKSLTSIIAGIAVDRQKLRTDALVASYFPDYPDARWVKERYSVTVDQLLSMDAGIEWNEDVPYDDPRNSTRPLLEADSPTAYILNRPLAHKPGSHYDYNSALPTLAGTLVARTVHEPYEAFAQRYLFEPLGIQNYRWARQHDNTVLAAGGFEMLPRDMLKLGQLMLDGGVWKDKRIVSTDWVHQSTTQHTPPEQYAYGYYWHLINPKQWSIGGETGYAAVGQAGQFIIVIPRWEMVAVITSANWQDEGTSLAYESVSPYLAATIH